MIARLEADELDIAIATQKIPHQSLHYIPLLNETFAIVAPHSITLPSGLSLAETEAWFSQQTWISYITCQRRHLKEPKIQWFISTLDSNR